VKNPNPIARARRIETRRKDTGYAERCFYCPETDVFCFELDHPVTKELDTLFKRTVCRNCHRKLEANRDIKELTKNGLHRLNETEREQLRRYLLLQAEDQDSVAGMLESPAASPQLVRNALRLIAASLRRKANSLSQSKYPPMTAAALEWDGTGCA
jgi:hypothetical protein